MSKSLGKMPSREDLSYLFDSETNSIKLLMENDIFKIERKCIYCPYGNMVEVYAVKSALKGAHI